MWSQLVLLTWMIMATSASVVMTRVERVCPDDVEPAGSVDVDDHGYIGVGGDDEGGEGVSRLEPVPSILIVHNVTRQEQARHTAGHQKAPVRVLWQLSHGLLSTIFASKSCHEQRQPCDQHQRELAHKS